MCQSLGGSSVGCIEVYVEFCRMAEPSSSGNTVGPVGPAWSIGIADMHLLICLTVSLRLWASNGATSFLWS
jgi:hypothetical protein